MSSGLRVFTLNCALAYPNDDLLPAGPAGPVPAGPARGGPRAAVRARMSRGGRDTRAASAGRLRPASLPARCHGLISAVSWTGRDARV